MCAAFYGVAERQFCFNSRVAFTRSHFSTFEASSSYPAGSLWFFVVFLRLPVQRAALFRYDTFESGEVHSKILMVIEMPFK